MIRAAIPREINQLDQRDVSCARERRRNMRTLLFMSIAAMALVINACTDTFLVHKNGRGVFLGSNMKAKYDVLCESGDIEKVLALSTLSKEMKDALYRYSCSSERSGEKVKQIYASMTSDERKDIKRAFRKNGYTINIMAT
jgi:hypothetical protein